MTTQSEHPMPEQQFDQPQQYGQPHHADPSQQFDQQGYAQPERTQPGAPAPAADGMTTEHLAGTTDGGTASTQQFADARPPQPAVEEDEESAPGHTPLFPDDERDSINDRWKQIQSTFVDEPRQAVQQADELVAELMQQLARMFADERGQLESQWAQGTDVSTEDLRQGLQRYREFFQRLLAA